MRKKYRPLYAFGGGMQTELPNMNSGMSPLNGGQSNRFGDWYQNNYQSVGNAAAGVNLSGMNNTGASGEDSYNKIMGGVSKAGPVGSAIGGITGVIDTVAKPIRKNAESINTSTGGYNNTEHAARMGIFGSLINPAKGGTMVHSDKSATAREKWGGPGGLREWYRRQDREMQEAKSEVDRQQFAGQRLLEEGTSDTMRFANGGKLFGSPQVNLGIVNPQAPVTGPYTHGRKGNYILPAYDRSRLDYGDVYGQNLINDPYTKESVGYEQFKTGYDKPTIAYFEPDQVKKVGNRNVMPGSEDPIKASGGYLEESRNNDEVTYFANGGTHGENKNGGIPLGNKGKVEEGEVRYKDYIFSNRF